MNHKQDDWEGLRVSGYGCSSAEGSRGYLPINRSPADFCRNTVKASQCFENRAVTSREHHTSLVETGEAAPVKGLTALATFCYQEMCCLLKKT